MTVLFRMIGGDHVRGSDGLKLRGNRNSYLYSALVRTLFNIWQCFFLLLLVASRLWSYIS